MTKFEDEKEAKAEKRAEEARAREAEAIKAAEEARYEVSVDHVVFRVIDSEAKRGPFMFKFDPLIGIQDTEPTSIEVDEAREVLREYIFDTAIPEMEEPMGHVKK